VKQERDQNIVCQGLVGNCFFLRVESESTKGSCTSRHYMFSFAQQRMHNACEKKGVQKIKKSVGK
jgi:hypothetical protein